MWFLTLMRTFFFALDNIVYNFIPKVYDLLLMIARTSPLSQADIAGVADRIYKFLAIFMVFKVTLSLITYVVNPDEFSDKTKGVSKLAQNAIVSLCVLILTPYIFSYAYQLQSMILEDNALGTLVFGEEKSAFNKAGEEMAFITLSAFFSPDASLEGLNECTVITKNVVGDKTSFNQSCSGLDSNYDPLSTEIGLYKKTINNEENFSQTTLKNYVAGVEGKSLGMMFRKEMAIASDKDKNYIMDYQWLISTAVGVIILLLLVTYCMDIAVRSIKLAFLQLIAPIPVISYIDPKSGKDGLFKKWYETCFKTYLSLFIRLLVIYLAVYIISIVSDLQFVDVITGEYQTGLLIKVFIIIGALMFAKQLPEILKGLGIKLDGDGKFFLNPLKKFEEQALGGKRITGAAGALTAGAVDRAARLATAPGFKGKVGALLGTGPGLIGAAARGFKSNEGFNGGLKKQSQVNRRLREGRMNGLSPFSSYLDYVGSTFGLDDASLEKEGTLIKDYDDKASKIKDSIERDTFNQKQSIAKEQTKQKTMKATSEARKNIGSQGDRMMKIAKDVADKKGNMGASYMSAADKISLGNFNFDEKEKKAMTKLGIKVPTNLNDISSSDFDKLYNEGRKLNYTANRTANESNLQKIQTISSNGGDLKEDLTFYGIDGNNYTIKAGTKITGDEYALAKEKVAIYEKESTKAVFDALANEDEDLSKSVLDGEAKSFKNISDEYKKAIEEAETVSKAYNKEYENDEDFEKINEQIKSTISYDAVKQNITDMDNDESTTRINNKIRNSNNEIERLTREINEIEDRDSNYIDYKDENGYKHHISIKEYEERMKLRRAKYDKEKKRRQEKRSIFINRN